MILRALLCVLLLSPSSSFGRSKQCSFIFSKYIFPPLLGKKSKHPQYPSDDYEVRYFDEGSFGKVFLIREKNTGYTFIHKDYKTQLSRKNDYRAFKFLQRFNGLVDGVSVLRGYEKNGRQALLLDYHKGRSLNWLLESGHLTTQQKELLIDRYNRFIFEVQKHARKKNLLTSFFQFDTLRTLITINVFVEKPHEFDIYIKPDNFIVDPITLEMTLIDPY